MAEKICPVCNRSNLSSAIRCWYCQSSLEDVPSSSALTPPAFPPEEVKSSAKDDVPDWLKRIRQRKAIENMESSGSRAAEDAPSKENEAAQEEQYASHPQPDSTPLPSWISDLGQDTQSESKAESAASAPEEDAENIDWLKKLSAWQAEDQPAPEALPVEDNGKSENSTPAEDTPQWVEEFLAPSSEPLSVNQAEGSGAVPAAAQEAEIQPGVGERVEDTPQDETYDFSDEQEASPALETIQPSLTEAGFTPLNTEIQPEPPLEPPDILKEAVSENAADLDWLTHYQEPAPEEPHKVAEEPAFDKADTQPLPPFWGVQKNDWATPPMEAQTGAEKETPENDVEPAAIPVWTKKLRSLESIPLPTAAPQDEAAPEGPLAGIRGVLQGSELPGAYARPPIYTNKVQVTDRQNLRAELLKNLLEEAPPEEVKPAVKKPARGKLLKVVVSVLLLATVFLTLTLAPGTSLLPMLYPPETVNAFQLVNVLANDRPVLVASDFEAGLSGEMGYTAQSLLEHLMLRNIPLTVLSTNPVGSALMDEMLTASQRKVTSYDLTTQVVRLGYLAGGSVGLQGLVANVRTALPYTRDLLPAWGTANLQNVHTLSDFGALVVFTDDADTGRYWVEQVQPALNGIPLILVTSAQAAPMLQPYYESGQISGVIAGISGGAAYEQILQLPGDASYYFGAYQMLVLVVILLILIGGVVCLLRPAANEREG